MPARLRSPGFPVRLLWACLACLAWPGKTDDADKGSAWDELGQRQGSPPAFVRVDQGLSPAVACALGREGDRLTVTVTVAEAVAGSKAQPTLALGVAARQALSLSEAEATVSHEEPGSWRYRFAIPAERLATAPADWEKLRLALAVAWPGGPAGAPRQQERFRHLDNRAPHAGLAALPAAWAPFSLRDYLDHSSPAGQIAWTVPQPLAGKLTVVVEDATGKRVRNLLAGVPAAAGPQTVTWDGLDDFGRLAAPGSYRWRSISHPGLVPQYLFGFANGGDPGLAPLLSNHGHFVAACANRDNAFLGAPITEGGWALIALDAEGRWQRGYHEAQGAGYYGVALAADDRTLYVAHDGRQPQPKTKRKGSDPREDRFITLTRYDLASTQVQNYGRNLFAVVSEYVHEPNAAGAAAGKKEIDLGGMALLGGKLCIASRQTDTVLVVDPATGKVENRWPLPAPGPLAAAGTRLVAASGEALVWLDPANGQTQPLLPAGRLQATGLALDPAGRLLYVADRRTHQVLACSLPDGRVVATFGQAGGPYQGPFDPARMVNPAGLAVFAGKLWVTEDRENPKRALAWDLATRRVVAQKFGNPPYGGPGSGFDPRDPQHWLGLRCGWRLDFATGTATCDSVLQQGAGHLGGLVPWCLNYRFLHQDGRIFLLGQGKANFVSELRPDGTVHDLAMLSGAHVFRYAMNWRTPEPFRAAFEAKFPEAAKDPQYSDPRWRAAGVLWVDRNGDGLLQSEEFEFTAGDVRIASSGWGHAFQDLTLRVPLTKPGGVPALLVLQPDGFRPSGAPNYPTLADAVAQAQALQELPPLQRADIHQASIVDRAGNLILNTDPTMMCFTPKGELRWHFPNRWSNVHGSHKAPLPSVGEMQGNLFFLGIAPLDAASDVFILNGNHGRFFALSSDGLYLDELFRDCRTGGPSDAQFVGGEPFGGSFGRADDGTYYLQTGGNGYRLYRLTGLDRAIRQEGTLSVGAEQLRLAAQRQRQAAPAGEKREAAARLAATPPKIDGDGRDWPAEPAIRWTRNGQFPVTVRCAWDHDNLYLLYNVAEASPWVNQGTDWTLLFKTGDSVDLQLATDPQAPPDRRGAAPGDLRLLVAPSEGKPLAVLYRYKAPGAAHPVTFTSPWRSYTVDSVERLASARIAVRVQEKGYDLELAVPLRDLGLDPARGTFKTDVGVLYGNQEGTQIGMRSYWANPFTALVNDVPGEIMPEPQAWGTLTFQPRERR